MKPPALYKSRFKPTPEIQAWNMMKQRCYNPKNPGYPDYGGRGITVCDRWLRSSRDFLADMGPRPSPTHSIDRKDNNGNYEPGNCRWATRMEQQNNRRFNHILTVDGVSKTVTEWARAKGLPRDVVLKRSKRGITLAKQLFAPTEARAKRVFPPDRRFGKLVASETSEIRERHCRWWLCRCDCGKSLWARFDHLIEGKTNCGCERSAKCSAAAIKGNQLRNRSRI